MVLVLMLYLAFSGYDFSFPWWLWTFIIAMSASHISDWVIMTKGMYERIERFYDNNKLKGEEEGQ